MGERMTLSATSSRSQMRTRQDAGMHPTFCTIQFLEDVDRSDPASRRSGRLLVGMRRRWPQAHPEEARDC